MEPRALARTPGADVGYQSESGALLGNAARQISRADFRKAFAAHTRDVRSWHPEHGRPRGVSGHTQARLGERESIADVARNLERWVHGIVARVYEQRVLDEMAATTDIPVINALSDRFHPCQALADYFTLEEKFGSLKGFKLAYVGDGNNVSHSLIYLAARLGVHLRIATPANYAPDADVVADSRRVAKETKAKIELFTDPREAVETCRRCTPIRGPAWALKRKKRFAAKCSNRIR